MDVPDQFMTHVAIARRTSPCHGLSGINAENALLDYGWSIVLLR